MTFEEVLNSKHRHLIEAIEHGCSDPELMALIKKELFEKTGYIYK